MSSAPREWLPLSIAVHASIRASLATAIEAWSEHWFARQRMVAGAIDGVAGGVLARDSGRSWRRYGENLAVNKPVGDDLPMAAWLLDAQWDPLLVGPADQLILQELETALLTDLCQRLEMTLGLSGAAPETPEASLDPLGRDGGGVVEVKDSRGALVLRIAIPLALMAAALKASMPGRTQKARSVAPRLSALGSTIIKAEARLGSADLALSELQNLGVGDVLVLNTKLDGLAQLAIEGMTRPLALGRVSNNEGRLSLTLEA